MWFEKSYCELRSNFWKVKIINHLQEMFGTIRQDIFFGRLYSGTVLQGSPYIIVLA